MNPLTVPTALLVTGHATPAVCVRHGQPAVFRLGVGIAKNWPFCARCRTRRWSLMAAAAAAAFGPFVVGFGLTTAFAADDTQARTYLQVTVFAVFVGLAVAGVIGLMNTPSALARAKTTPDKQWIIFQGSHPTFAAEMNRIIGPAPDTHQAAHIPPATESSEPTPT
ncbi:hypothetical protein [Virgisporangium aurantiacum]|uniref:hypothetical protein n=1 Tax=Virgisporangium aurantiacum TaxID=175570 RepID=UPI00194E5D37|nr:hypothetical protein [Virgisporangium aurantiacum]